MSPMDLDNMRKNGVRHLQVFCYQCRHEADVNADDFPGHLAVKSFEGRFKCSECGSKRVEVRPAWHTNPKRILPPYMQDV